MSLLEQIFCCLRAEAGGKQDLTTEETPLLRDQPAPTYDGSIVEEDPRSERLRELISAMERATARKIVNSSTAHPFTGKPLLPEYHNGSRSRSGSRSHSRSHSHSPSPSRSPSVFTSPEHIQDFSSFYNPPKSILSDPLLDLNIVKSRRIGRPKRGRLGRFGEERGVEVTMTDADEPELPPVEPLSRSLEAQIQGFSDEIGRHLQAQAALRPGDPADLVIPYET